MSSHHVIRDEQEPPILAFTMHDNWEELSELLGWSPILLIDPELKELFELKKTKIDGYLVKENRLNDVKGSDLYYQEDSLAESILGWIGNKDYTAVNIFCDQLVMMEVFKKLQQGHFPVPVIFFTQRGKYILKTSTKFRKWYPQDFKIDILNEDLLEIKNLIGTEGSFMVEKDGFVNIEVGGDLILIKEG